MKRTALLTHDESLALIRDAQAGSIAARNRLIESNMGLIRTQTARACRNRTNEFLSHGVEGFIGAVKKFDATLGMRLSTFAAAYVWGYVKRATDENALIRVPRGPCNRPGGQFAEQAERAGRVMSIDLATSGSRYGGGRSTEWVKADTLADTDDCDEAAEAREFVTDCLARMPKRYAEIIRDRMQGQTLDGIGKRFGLSRERVRQLEHRAHRMIRTGDYEFEASLATREAAKRRAGA